MTSNENNPFEILRHFYRPQNCSVVLIGESASAAGNFFYSGDALCTYTREAFAIAFPEARIPNNNIDFLGFFRDKGFFLDDLCLIPVNNAGAAIRQRHHRESIPSLANRLREYQPQEVICIMLAISGYVRSALNISGLPANTPFFAIPFGGHGQQGRYRQELVAILRDLQQRNVIIIN